jgi:hypothetical protein
MAKSKSSSKGKRRTKKQEPTPQDNVVAAFMGCGRCSFFLVGYRLIFDDFEQAVEKSESNHLTLSWNHAVSQLIQKTYGSQIEEDAYHYQGSCRECQRSHNFQVGETAEDPPTLEIAIKNR